MAYTGIDHSSNKLALINIDETGLVLRAESHYLARKCLTSTAKIFEIMSLTASWFWDTKFVPTVPVYAIMIEQPFAGRGVEQVKSDIAVRLGIYEAYGDKEAKIVGLYPSQWRKKLFGFGKSPTDAKVKDTKTGSKLYVERVFEQFDLLHLRDAAKESLWNTIVLKDKYNTDLLDAYCLALCGVEGFEWRA